LVSEIGLLPAASPLPLDQQIEVMVRPHDLRVTRAPFEASNGVISAAQFVGDIWQYSVRLSSGRSIHCQMPHTDAYPLGTPVQVRLDAGHGLVCFEGQRRVN
jgi:ABC-type Fe3+/spermidine/putrescine transport system ATPase subunit